MGLHPSPPLALEEGISIQLYVTKPSLELREQAKGVQVKCVEVIF